MQSYKQLRLGNIERARALAPALIDQIGWSADRLAAERERRLRRLLRLAINRSPWHRTRLAGVEPERVRESDLSELPVMTKNDLMEHFDTIVTDRRLTFERVQRHLEALRGDAYLLDEYHALATGGSTNRRGVFLYDAEAWAIAHVGFFRYLLAQRASRTELRTTPEVMAMVASGTPMHFSYAEPETFSDPSLILMPRFPITLPLERIVAGLNRTQPTILSGYPSALRLLADAAGAGELRVRPRLVITYSETLLASVRAVLEETWGVPVHNVWGTSEGGPTGVTCDGGVMHLSDDLLILEPVDRWGAAVPVGARAANVYLTNLYNGVLPLIRYELNDEITLSGKPCPCGSAHRTMQELTGRLEDDFRYGDLLVHGVLFNAHLERERGVLEYQVQQTRLGADVRVVCTGGVALEPLAEGIRADLAALGLAEPQVSISRVAGLERGPAGKLRRFVALPSDGDSARATLAADDRARG